MQTKLQTTLSIFILQGRFLIEADTCLMVTFCDGVHACVQCTSKYMSDSLRNVCTHINWCKFGGKEHQLGK